MSLYQIITSAFAVLMLANVVSNFLRHDKSWRELAVWFVVWGSVIVVSIYPKIVNLFAQLTGFESGVNALVFFALVLVFYSLFRLVLKFESMENRIVDIARVIALRGQVDLEIRLHKSVKKKKGSSKPGKLNDVQVTQSMILDKDVEKII